MSTDFDGKVMPAPQWLVDRMERISQLPPPTLEEVETAFRASEAVRLQETTKPTTHETRTTDRT